MGVASGVLDEKEECLSCRVLQVARVVSDAGSGGQVLLDSATFAQVKDRCVVVWWFVPSTCTTAVLDKF
jgi:hypothetical protein